MKCNIPRYDPDPSGWSEYPYEEADGDYCLFSDVEPLLSIIERLADLIEEASEEIKKINESQGEEK